MSIPYLSARATAELCADRRLPTDSWSQTVPKLVKPEVFFVQLRTLRARPKAIYEVELRVCSQRSQKTRLQGESYSSGYQLASTSSGTLAKWRLFASDRGGGRTPSTLSHLGARPSGLPWRALRRRIGIRATEDVRIAKGGWTVTVRGWWCWE
jgi:hypothetical protein